MIVFIDESGDLGFDLLKPGPSTHFVITALVLEHDSDRKRLEKGVERTLKNKINIGKPGKDPTLELKGTKTSIEVKSYFWKQIRDLPFAIYSMILEKKMAPPTLTKDQERLYNHLAYRLMEQVPIGQANPSLLVEIDKCKGSKGCEELNKYLGQHIKGRLDPRTGVRILHRESHCSRGIQAADLFCWGIARKHHSGDQVWYDVFSDKIAAEINELVVL